MAGADHPGPGLGLKIIEFHPIPEWDFFAYMHMCQRWQVSQFNLDRPKTDWTLLSFNDRYPTKDEFPLDNDIAVVLQLGRSKRKSTRRKLYQLTSRSIHPKGVCFFGWRNAYRFARKTNDYVSELQHHFKYVRLYKETGSGRKDLDLICVAECRIPI